MNLDRAASIAEITSSVAVVVTLVFLFIEVRDTNEQLKADKRDRTQDQVTDIRTSIYENRDVAELIVKGLTDQDSIDEIDRYRFDLYLDQTVWTHYQIYTRYKDSKNDTTWSAAAGPNLAAILQQPGAAIWWQRSRHKYDQLFVQATESYMEPIEK